MTSDSAMIGMAAESESYTNATVREAVVTSKCKSGMS